MHAHAVHDTHMQVQNMPQLQPQPQLAQQVLAGRELARKQHVHARRLEGFAEDRQDDLEMPSSFEGSAGLPNARQK